MVIMLIAGLWALLVGKISVAPKLTLHGKYPRIYGVALLLSFLPLSIMIGALLFWILPESMEVNEILMKVLNLMMMVLIVVGVAYPFKVWQEKSLHKKTNDK